MPDPERTTLRQPSLDSLRERSLRSVSHEELERFGLDRLRFLATKEQEREFLRAAAAFGDGTSTQTDRLLLERVLGKLPRVIEPEDLIGVCGESPMGLFQVTTVGEIVRFLTRKFGVSFALSEGITTDIVGIQPEEKRRRDTNPYRWVAKAISAGRRDEKVMARLGPEAGTRYYSAPPMRDVDIVTVASEPYTSLTAIFSALDERPHRDHTLVSWKESRRRKFPYITIIPSGESSKKALLGQIHYLEDRGKYAPNNSLLDFALCRGTLRSLLILLVPVYHRESRALSGVVIDPLGALDFANCVSVGDQKYSLDVFPFFERAFPMENPPQALASLLHTRRSEAWSNGIPVAFHETLPGEISTDWIIKNWKGLTHIFAYYAYHQVIRPIAENPEIISNESYRARSAIDLVQELFVSSLNGDPAGAFICLLAPGTHRDDISPHYGHGFIELFPALSRFLTATNPETGCAHQESLLLRLSQAHVGDGGKVFFDYLGSHLSPREIIEVIKPSIYPYSTEEFISEAEEEPELRAVFKNLRQQLEQQEAGEKINSLTAPEIRILMILTSLSYPPSSVNLRRLARLSQWSDVLRRLRLADRIFYLNEQAGARLVATDGLLERFKKVVGNNPRTTRELAKLLGLPLTDAFRYLKLCEKAGLIKQLSHRRTETDRAKRSRLALWGLPDTPPPRSNAELVLEAIRSGRLTCVAIHQATGLKEGTVRAIAARLQKEGLIEVTRELDPRRNMPSVRFFPVSEGSRR